MRLLKLKDVVLDILFPPICLSCLGRLERSENKNSRRKICEKCESSAKLNNSLFCPKCRARLPENKKICHFDCHYILGAAGDYDNPVIHNLIHQLKYRRLDAAAEFLSEFMARYLTNISSAGNLDISEFTAMPIPLHKKRERKRGFNQAELLARGLSRSFGIPIANVILRIKNNNPQASIADYEERSRNITGCFAVENPEAVAGKNILLIDDVFTSGATMNEAAKILKQAGAKKIIALAAAKA